MLRGPFSFGVVSPRYVVGGREAPLAVGCHEEGNVFGVIVLVATDDIEHHPAEHLFGLAVRQMKLAHHLEGLLVGIGTKEFVVEVRQSTEGLHVQFLIIVGAVEAARHKVCSSVFF